MTICQHQIYRFTVIQVQRARELARQGRKDEARDWLRYWNNAPIVEALKKTDFTGLPGVDIPQLEWQIRELEKECHPSSGPDHSDDLTAIRSSMDFLAQGHGDNSQTAKIMSERCHCKRCGNNWYPRYKWDYKKSIHVTDHVPVRCAKCRSPFWNKDYVRNISPNRLNPNSDFDKQDIPLLFHAKLPAHRGSSVRIKISGGQCNAALMDKKSSHVRQKTISPSVKRAAEVGCKQAPTAHRRRAGVKAAKKKHGKTKGTK